jgi:hypothetical protein
MNGASKLRTTWDGSLFKKREDEDEDDWGTRASRELARYGWRGVSFDECRPASPPCSPLQLGRFQT